MPKFVIERQYLVPMYQHIVIEAETLEAACETAMSDDIGWDIQEMDCDNARATTITQAKAIPAGYDVDPLQRVLIAAGDPTGISFASLLYGNEAETGALLKIPAKFTDGDQPPSLLGSS
jgi:hypothetical protein